jgi:hypothetical protein
MGMTRSGVAVLALVAALGVAAGAVVAMVGNGPGGSAAPPETTVESAPTSSIPESGFWTAVIASVEASRSDAQARADQVVQDAATRDQEAFVLDGRAYEGLGDAYLAVCVGRFADQEAAADQVAVLEGLGYEPYTRNVGDLTSPDGGDGEGDGDA